MSGQRKAARRFDYKIIILHFLLHGTHFSGQTEADLNVFIVA